MSELLLIVEIAGEKVAIRADDVESVADLELLAPVPRSPAHVAGLSTLRSRVLTVIDCQCALGLGPSANRAAGASVTIVVHGGHAYALLLDKIEDVTQARSDPAPAGSRLGGNWGRMSHGVVDTDEGPLLLIDVAALIDGVPDARAA